MEEMEVENATIFKFKQFDIRQEKCTMKVNTDGVLLGAWSDTTDKTMALDVGTGTGVIAIMLAQKNQNLNVTGIDIDATSCEEAKTNMLTSKFGERLSISNISVQEFAPSNKRRFDLIISNPPFFTGGTFSNNENKANVRHTTKLPHADLIRSVKLLLTNDGHFDLILPYIEGLRFIELAGQSQLYVHKMTEVKSRPEKPVERLLIRMGMNQVDACAIDNMVIHKGSGPNDYTEDFIRLTREFYLFMP